MKLSDVSIRRPIFTAMIMMAIVVFGGVMYTRLSVDLFPKVDFPIVTITVVYPGADPETMETKVADPIEEAVNSLSGIDQLRSTSLEGVAQVFVQFELGVDLDAAAQDVRDRVAEHPARPARRRRAARGREARPRRLAHHADRRLGPRRRDHAGELRRRRAASPASSASTAWASSSWWVAASAKPTCGSTPTSCAPTA